jgi:hypothetical protein
VRSNCIVRKFRETLFHFLRTYVNVGNSKVYYNFHPYPATFPTHSIFTLCTSVTPWSKVPHENLFLSCSSYLMESEGSLPCSQKLAIHPCVELEVSSTLRVCCDMYYHRTYRFWSQLAVFFLPPQENKYLPPPLLSSQFLLSEPG